LRGVVVELHAEGEQQREQVALLGGVVEAENVLWLLDRIELLARFGGDGAKEAGLGGVGDLGWGDVGGPRGWGLSGGEGNDGGVAVDGVASGLLGDDWVTVLLELTEDLLAGEGAKVGGCSMEDFGAGVVDGGEDKDGGADGGDGAGGQVRLSAERGSAARWSRGLSGSKAARVKVGDVQERIVESFGDIRGGLIGWLREGRRTNEEQKRCCRT